ncbi:MAG: hypothetical protein Q7R94_00905 [bacterium]|nr:hypothetical protein [bacterium]
MVSAGYLLVVFFVFIFVIYGIVKNIADILLLNHRIDSDSRPGEWKSSSYGERKDSTYDELSRVLKNETHEERTKRIACETRFIEYARMINDLCESKETPADYLLNIFPLARKIDEEYAVTSPWFSGPWLADKIETALTTGNYSRT